MSQQASGWSNETDIIPTRKLGSNAQAKADILAQLEKLGDKKPAFKGLIYGTQGTGKTVTALKIAQELAPEDRPGILYIDTAENWSSLLNHPELKKNVLRFQYTSWDDILIMANMIFTGEGPFAKVGAIVIDEYNSYFEYDLSWITMQRSKHAELDKKEYRDPYFPQRPDYLAAMHRSNILIDGIMKLNINFIAVSHSTKDEKTFWTAPDISPAARKGLMRRVHVVAHAERNENTTGDKQFTLQISPVAKKKVEAKGRIGKLGDVVTVNQLISAYQEWGENSDAPIKEVKTEPTVSEKTKETIESNDLLAPL